MKIEEGLAKLISAKRRMGDVALTHLDDGQFGNVTISTMKRPTPEMKWVWAGPVVVFDFSPAIMTETRVSDAIRTLRAARKEIGIGADLTFIAADQFCDVTDFLPLNQPTSTTRAYWAGPVVVAVKEAN